MIPSDMQWLQRPETLPYGVLSFYWTASDVLNWHSNGQMRYNTNSPFKSESDLADAVPLQG